MRWRWKALPVRNGGSEKKLVAEAHRLGESMSVMVGRMEILVERLQQELERYKEDDFPQGGGGGSGPQR